MSTTELPPVVRTLRVRRFNPPWQWHVASESEPDQPHLVDITGYQGNGECSCRHFRFRLAPELRMGRTPSPATRCKHIRAAREALLNTLVREHLQQ